MLYFIDGARSGGSKLYAEHGLKNVLDSPGFREYLGSGPGGRSGGIVSSGGDIGRYEPDKQTWVPRFGRPGTYVGFWNDSTPTA